VGRPGGGAALSRRTGPFLCELALYTLLTVVSFLPQSLRPADTVAYVGDSLPVLVPLARSTTEHEMARDAPTGIDLRHYLATAPGNVLYGQIGGEVRLQQRAAHFVGFFTLALAALAGARARRGPEAEPSLLPSRTWVPAAA
jgi:hypothetical protein